MEEIRARQRAKRKLYSKRQDKLDRYNSFGILDLTPYEAIINLRGVKNDKTRKSTSDNSSGS